MEAITPQQKALMIKADFQDFKYWLLKLAAMIVLKEKIKLSKDPTERKYWIEVKKETEKL